MNTTRIDMNTTRVDDLRQRKLAAAIAQRDKAVSRYEYVKEHFDEIYQLPIWTNDVQVHGNPDYRIDSDKFDAAIDAAMKECGK